MQAIRNARKIRSQGGEAVLVSEGSYRIVSLPLFLLLNYADPSLPPSAFARNPNRERSGSLGARLFQKGGNNNNAGRKSTILEGNEAGGLSPSRGSGWRRGSGSVPQSPSTDQDLHAAQTPMLGEESSVVEQPEELTEAPRAPTPGRAF